MPSLWLSQPKLEIRAIGSHDIDVESKLAMIDGYPESGNMFNHHVTAKVIPAAQSQ